MLKGITPHENESKDLTLEVKQATPCEVSTKELNIQVNASNPCALKWNVREGISKPFPRNSLHLSNYHKLER